MTEENKGKRGRKKGRKRQVVLTRGGRKKVKVGAKAGSIF